MGQEVLRRMTTWLPPPWEKKPHEEGLLLWLLLPEALLLSPISAPRRWWASQETLWRKNRPGLVWSGSVLDPSAPPRPTPNTPTPPPKNPPGASRAPPHPRRQGSTGTRRGPTRTSPALVLTSFALRARSLKLRLRLERLPPTRSDFRPSPGCRRTHSPLANCSRSRLGCSWLHPGTLSGSRYRSLGHAMRVGKRRTQEAALPKGMTWRAGLCRALLPVSPVVVLGDTGTPASPPLFSPTLAGPRREKRDLLPHSSLLHSHAVSSVVRLHSSLCRA